MTPPNTCYSRQQLSTYLQGWGSDQDATEMEVHLQRCAACEQTICELESETDFLAKGAGSDRLPAGDGSYTTDGERASSETDPVSPAAAKLGELIESIKSWQADDPASAVRWNVDFLPPGTTLGSYQLLERIGQGGMAEVYRARHQKLGKLVAIKLLRIFRGPMSESFRRMEREIAALGRLSHPAIVAAIDAGEQDGIQFLVTELVDGLDLGRIAKGLGRLPVAEACEAIRVAAIGLDAAHAQGVVHRDLKPSNLMLDRGGQVKILDFGLVQLEGWQGASVELTTVGQLLGTLDYMAPEQAERAEAVDHRSDVYALGATLFRLLCGRAPFAASSNQSPLEKLRLLANSRPPLASTLRPELPGGLVELIEATLDRDPARRPPSAAHLAEALAPFCDSADLVELLERVQQQLKSGDDAASGNSIAIAEIAPVPMRIPDHRGGRRWVGRLLTLALAAAALVSGVVIVLDTQKGQLVIESDSANIRVRVLRDGRQYDELQVKPGATSTRLFAGQYEIEIEGAADNYTLDKNQVTLERGGVVLARITQRALDVSKPEQLQIAAADPRSDGPLYDGRPLSSWLEALQREQNPKQWAEILQAVAALNSADTADQIRETLVAVLTMHSGQWWDETPRLGNLLASLALSDSDWQKILATAKAEQASGKLAYLGLFWSIRAVDPTRTESDYSFWHRGFDVAIDLLSDPKCDPGDFTTRKIEQFLSFRRLFVEKRESELEKRVASEIDEFLSNPEYFGTAHWLSVASLQQSSNWNPIELRYIAKSAIDRLGNQATNPSDAIVAAALLCGLASSLNQDELGGLQSIVDQRLAQLASHAMQSEFMAVPDVDYLRVQDMPPESFVRSAVHPTFGEEIYFMVSGSRRWTCELLELVRLAAVTATTNRSNSPRAGLDAVQKAIEEPTALFWQALPSIEDKNATRWIGVQFGQPLIKSTPEMGVSIARSWKRDQDGKDHRLPKLEIGENSIFAAVVSAMVNDALKRLDSTRATEQ